MKRIMACLAAFCLFTSSVLPAGAAGNGGMDIPGGMQGSTDAGNQENRIGLTENEGGNVQPQGQAQNPPKEAGTGGEHEPDGSVGGGQAVSGTGSQDGAQSPAGSSSQDSGQGSQDGAQSPAGGSSQDNGQGSQDGAQTPGGGAQSPSNGTGQDGVQPSADGTVQNGSQPSADRTVQGGMKPSADGTAQNGSQPSADGTAQNGSQPSADGTAQNGSQPSADGTVQDGVQIPSDGVPQDGSPGNGALPGTGKDGNGKLIPAAPAGNTQEGRAGEGMEWNNEGVSSEPVGGIQVILRNVLPIENLTLDVAVERDGSIVASKSVALENNPEKHIVSFSLESGTYHLKVSAPGFLAFGQDITVERDIRTAEIHTGFINLEGIAYTGGALHPGVMIIGDANGDGLVNDSDKDAILDAISAGGSGATDLNRDGKTDLVDLQYYANGRVRKDSGADTAAPLTGSIAPGAVKVNINGASTRAEGDLTGLLSGEAGAVRLSRGDGQVISGDSPVEIGFNLQNREQQGTRVEQIEISMGENAVENGWLVVETDTGIKYAEIVNGQAAEIRDGTEGLPAMFFAPGSGASASGNMPASDDIAYAVDAAFSGSIAYAGDTVYPNGMVYAGNKMRPDGMEYAEYADKARVNGMMYADNTMRPNGLMHADNTARQDGMVYADNLMRSNGTAYVDGRVSGDMTVMAAAAFSAVPESRAASGSGAGKTITVYLGKQVAVKKVSLRITGTAGSGTLAEITKVEFLNDMENRIPEPDMNIPEGLAAAGGDKSFSLTWKPQVNVTGYEVEISYGGQTETVRAASSQLEVKSFQGGKLVNGESYGARVRSVNGTWTSPYSETVQAVPEVSKRPDPPDNLKAVGGFRCIRLTWKNMKDTDTYNVYYKEAGESSFRKIEGIGQNQYEITGLKDLTTYEVYVTGVNILGESNPSIHSEAKTITLQPVQMPKYKLLNESNGEGRVSAHIVSATHGRGTMEASPLDTDSTSALGTVDKDFASYYQILDWDDGAHYVAASKGLLFTLDDYYKMSYITFAEPEDIASYGKVSVYYYDREHPDGTYAQNVSVLQRADANGRKYYLIKLAEPVTANKIRLGFARGYALRNITVAEVNFYHYDSLEDDILALYGDDLHTTLKEGVTEETIRALQERLDTIDEKSGEYHPERAALQMELNNARGLLESGFNDVVQINTQITAGRDGHLGFSGLNAWQPLGVTAYEGEQIVVYVGHNQLKTGSNSALRLVATQYHAEAGAFASTVATLKVGRNEITIPGIQSLACEGGGALYVQYTGNNANDRYAVRVNGGAKEPVLNLYGVEDGQERRALITSYVRELEAHVASQEEKHRQIHEAAGEGNKVNRAYDKQNCILGATDIMLEKMMLSVSAEQILAGLGSGTVEERAERLDQSLQAMDGMMELFYQHKGLSRDESAPATDKLPAQHLNIRYMRMFAGAFMYASGNHIGIEWGSVPGLASASPVISDGNGKYISGNYFGWGIGHEIGHNINQGSYAIAEVTNNYFAQLAGAKDSNSSVRFKYEDVYKKVTSNTVGKPSNVFTHLAMYWQLHLAYDRGYNYKTYESYQEQMDNLFYARVDSYSRNTSLAPGGLTLDGDKDQNIMRLACAAAGKDLTEFFGRWGLVPDAGTVSYAAQFPKEERALYYLTDDARVYEMEHGITGSVKGSDVIGQGSSVRISADAGVSNEVVVSIQDTTGSDAVLGYEIARYHYEDGKAVRQVVGFSTGTAYYDHVTGLNNRVLTYEVTAVDKFGYRSQAKQIGDVRISHDGSHDKSLWTVTTNMVSGDDHKDTGTEEDPCDPEEVSAVYRIVDNDYSNTYSGQASGSDAWILLQMNRALEVCGLKYTVTSGTPAGDYEIQVSVDGSSWTTVKTGRFENKAGSQTVYFENAAGDPWVCTYDAAYVRLTASGQSGMSISEIDLLGPTGDSISFGVRENDTQGAAGILQEDYAYETKAESRVIPAGSLVFTGSYKGNPAYNVVVIYDGESNIVGGVDGEGTLKADQIILANVPENGLLGEVSDGIWIYWIEPENGQVPNLGGKTVRAQLYRVDNALTNEGQRLVSDTMPMRIPDTLDQITLKGNEEAGNGAVAQ